MQFHNYRTMKPPGFRGTALQFIEEYLQTPQNNDEVCSVRGPLEASWLKHDRPFYNVYPIAVELCQKTSLNMKWGDIKFPTRNLLLRFAGGSEPLGIKAALLRVPSEQKISTRLGFHESRAKPFFSMGTVPLGGIVQRTSEPLAWVWAYYPSSGDIRDELVADTLPLGFTDGFSDAPVVMPEADGRSKEESNFLVRLLAFIGLLARGTDLITPAILAADREEYDATSDESRKRWLEKRAARRQGRGFDIGRSLEIERATSPHWRSPHLALFHTGPGRTVPALKLRSGCVVIPKDMSQVPTGYLGPEKELEEHKELPEVFRTHIPSRMRFHVFRRDGHRCRLCGMTADDGVKLECDHIIAVAKGGKTEIPNLWTLCRPCNNGKSDSDLHLALEENRAMEKARKEVRRGIRV
ncbi:MAG: HNH endonuclease [Planctomycetota bacterium]|nr:HNH endonuclease [Planctomycetota bacterium]